MNYSYSEPDPTHIRFRLGLKVAETEYLEIAGAYVKTRTDDIVVAAVVADIVRERVATAAAVEIVVVVAAED